MTGTPRVRPRDIVIVGLLIAGLLAGLLLVIFGGSSGDGGESTEPTLPLDDLTRSAVEDWSGLDVPDDAAKFLTASVGDAQLDVTFTMSPQDEAAFLEGSGLPTPVDGERQILHSSPLWKLNPSDDPAVRSGGGSTTEGGGAPTTDSTDTTDTTVAPGEVVIRGTSDTHDGYARAVELYDESPGVVRARIVLTPA